MNVQQQNGNFTNGNINPAIGFSNMIRTYNNQPPNIDDERDKKRIDVLLQINTILLQKCIILQAYVMNKSNTGAMDYNQKKVMYQSYLKRIHMNLMCLASINDIHTLNNTNQKKNYTLPQIVFPPQELPELNEYYKSLDELYPDAVFLYQKRMEIMVQQQRVRRQQQQQQQQSPVSQQNFGNSPGSSIGMPDGRQTQRQMQLDAFRQQQQQLQNQLQQPQQGLHNQTNLMQQRPQQLSQIQKQQQLYRQFLQQRGKNGSPKNMNSNQAQKSKVHIGRGTGQSFQFFNESFDGNKAQNVTANSQQNQPGTISTADMISNSGSPTNPGMNMDNTMNAIENVLSPEQILAKVNSSGAQSNDANGGMGGLNNNNMFNGWQM